MAHDVRYSEVISEFLNLIHEVQQEYNIAIGRGAEREQRDAGYFAQH